MTNMVTKELGTLNVETSGTGLYSATKRTVPLKLVVSADLESIERDEAGKLDFIYCTFRAYFDEAFWNEAVDGLMYTDKAVEDAINNWLVEQDFASRPQIGWSEQGMQGDDYADFDMDYELLYVLFPEQVKEVE